MSTKIWKKLFSNSILKFGVVGTLATLTYYYAAISLRELFNSLPTLVTNLVAYCIAMIVSYVGHYFWTYKAQGNHGSTMAKYIISAFFGSALNSVIVYICLSFSMQYKPAMIVAIILVPAVAYVINKQWVFSAKPDIS